MTKKLILVAGESASGKTFAAKSIAQLLDAVFLDKDEMCKSFTEYMLTYRLYEKTDRDCDFYKTTIMPLEYKTMMLSALDNLAASNAPVVCAAPFIDQLQDTSWINLLLVNLQPLDVELYVIWINSDLETLKLRTVVRAAVKDQSKISNWDEYSQNILTSPPNTPLSIAVLDNSQSSPKTLTSQIREVVASIS